MVVYKHAQIPTNISPGSRVNCSVCAMGEKAGKFPCMCVCVCACVCVCVCACVCPSLSPSLPPSLYVVANTRPINFWPNNKK